VTAVFLAALALAAQVMLGWPVWPGWLAPVLLPMVFVVGPPLLHEERRWPHFALALGLAWDLVLEPVIGPGTIAWSAAAVVVSLLAPLLADRTPRAWFAFGAIGAATMVFVRQLALLPLGLATPLTLRYVLLAVALTALWCAVVGWLIGLDLPSRWRARRARRLR
jgi:hypothetical protein